MVIVESQQAGPSGRPGLEAMPRTWWLSLHARLLSAQLDRELAAGDRPETCGLLAAHAERICRPDECISLAMSLRRLASEGADPGSQLGRKTRHRRRVHSSGRVPLDRAAIAATTGQLGQLAARMETPGPVRAEGVARVRCLISDGTGPLYHPEAGGTDLREALRAALEHL